MDGMRVLFAEKNRNWIKSFYLRKLWYKSNREYVKHRSFRNVPLVSEGGIFMSTFRMGLMDYGRFLVTLLAVIAVPVVFFVGLVFLVSVTSNIFISALIYFVIMGAVTLFMDHWDYKHHMKSLSKY